MHECDRCFRGFRWGVPVPQIGREEPEWYTCSAAKRVARAESGEPRVTAHLREVRDPPHRHHDVRERTPSQRGERATENAQRSEPGEARSDP